MYNKNAAYDLGALEEKKQGKVVKLPGKKARRKDQIKAQRMFLTGVFSLFLVSAAGVSAFVLGQARLTEFTDQTAKASKNLQEYKSINTQLNMKLEAMRLDNKKRSLDEGSSQVEIIYVGNGDTAKVS